MFPESGNESLISMLAPLL
jgi:hypothetical protein